MDSDTLTPYRWECTVEEETFDGVCDRLTRWITRCMTAWFGEDWAVPLMTTKFDNMLPRGSGAWDDWRLECERGEIYFLGQPGYQVAVTKGVNYWSMDDKREDDTRFFRIVECSLRGSKFPSREDIFSLFMLYIRRSASLPPDEPGVAMEGFWFLPPDAHETALTVLREEFPALVNE